MGIDVLIIKRKKEIPIRKNIGRIFRNYNIIEYKSPEDYLTIDDFYKVYGYACFYKADTGGLNEIQSTDITITLVCMNYPRKMLKLLQQERKLTVRKIEVGIYYIEGDQIPIQLLVTSQLLIEENLWLRSLSNQLRTIKEVNVLSREYQKNRSNELYVSMMDIIVKANEKKFKEAKNMCNAIIDLFRDEYDEGIRKNTEQVTEQVTQQVTIMVNIKSKKESVLELLEDFGEISEELHKKIMDQKDVTILKKWLKLAARVESMEEFQQRMEK